MNAMQEYVIKQLEPGDKPCDCIELYGHFWVQRCDCLNSGDLAEAESWVTKANIQIHMRDAFEKPE